MFDQHAFGVTMLRHSDAISSAWQAGNATECQRRIDAAIVWLEQQKRSAPAAMCSMIDSAIADLKAKTPQVRATSVATNAAQPVLDDEFVRSQADQTLRTLRQKIPGLPPIIREHLAVCLAAVEGVPVPDSPLTADHLFAMFWNGLTTGIELHNQDQVALTAGRLREWAERAPIHPRFNRDDIRRRVETLIHDQIEGPAGRSGGTNQNSLPQW